MKKPAIFICFAGLDGSGKSSQAKLLQEHLGSSGIKVIYTWSRWEPFLLKPLIKLFMGKRPTNAAASSSGSLLSKKRKFLRNPIVLFMWLNLALFDYYWQVRNRVIKYIKSTDIVICDRYLFDFVIDQTVNMGNKEGGIEYIFKYFLTTLFPLPDLLYILDVDPNTGQSRKQDGTSVEYLAERRELYCKLKTLPYAVLIDSNKPFDTVASQISERTNTFLKENNICLKS